jgi:hypothetical protein
MYWVSVTRQAVRLSPDAAGWLNETLKSKQGNKPGRKIFEKNQTRKKEEKETGNRELEQDLWPKLRFDHTWPLDKIFHTNQSQHFAYNSSPNQKLNGNKKEWRN